MICNIIYFKEKCFTNQISISFRFWILVEIDYFINFRFILSSKSYFKASSNFNIFRMCIYLCNKYRVYIAEINFARKFIYKSRIELFSIKSEFHKSLILFIFPKILWAIPMSQENFICLLIIAGNCSSISKTIIFRMLNCFLCYTILVK